jgi:WD40 repeat protein
MEAASAVTLHGHDAFISYSRVDKAFAAALATALGGYKPPRDLKVAQRHLKVFRDEQDFTGTEYTSAIQQHLKGSRKLIVVCSPAARASKYVNEEIQLFARANGAENIVPILLAGTPNNEARAGQEGDLAFPAALCEALVMPLAAAYQGFDLRKHKVDRGVFESSWFSILANLYGISRSELEQRERRRQQRARRLWAAITASAVTILAGLTAWAAISQRQAVREGIEARFQRIKAGEERTEADLQRGVAEIRRQHAVLSAEAERRAKEETERQRQIAVTRQLAAQAELTINQQPQLLPTSVLLAVESLHSAHQTPSLEGYQALRHGLGLLPQKPVLLPGQGVFVDMSPDGSHMVTLGPERSRGVIRVWRMSSAREVARRVDQVPAGSATAVAAAAVSPGGRQVALLRVSGVDIWDVDTDSVIHLNPGIRAPVAARFSQDGQHLGVIGYAGGIVRVWSVADWKPLRPDKRDPVVAMAFTPNESLLTVGHGILKEWPLTSTSARQRCTVASGRIAAFGGDGSHVAVVAADGTVRVWQVGQGAEGCRELARIRHQEGVTGVAVTSDGRHLVIASRDGTARLWVTTDNREIAWMTHDAGVASVSFDSKGRRLASASLDGEVKVWGIAENGITWQFVHDDEVQGVAFGPDAAYVATASRDGAVRVWELAGGAASLQPAHVVRSPFSTVNDLRGDFEPPRQIRALAFSPGGRYLASLSSDDSDSKLETWDLVKRTPLRDRLRPVADVRALTISADGAQVAVVTDVGAAELTRLGGGLDEWRRWGTGEVVDATFDPGRGRLATAGPDLTVTLRDVTGRSPVVRLPHDRRVEHLSFSASGTYLVTMTEDRFAWVWDMRTRSRIARIQLDADARVRAVSHEGRYVATTAAAIARVWDVPTGREVARLVHAGTIHDLVFSADGRFIATASADHTARVWLWRPEDLVAEACARLTRPLSRKEWKSFIGDERPRPTCPEVRGSGQGR